ncbi:MAG: CHAT domain-containing protein [Solirubrobacterales bacterium]
MAVRPHLAFTLTAAIALAVALPPTGPALAQSSQATPQAEKLAQKGKQALDAGDAAAAFASFLKAHELAPSDRNYVHNAAALAAVLGQTDKAAQLYRAALALAAPAGAREDALLYVQEIAKLVDTAPAWVAERQQSASAVPEAKARVLAMWQKRREQALTAAKAGDAATALEQAEMALSVARDNLGEAHLATIASGTDVARLKAMAAQFAAADEAFRQTIAAATQALGAGHPETLAILSAQAETEAGQARYLKAAEIYEQAAKTAGQALGAGHPRTLDLQMAWAAALVQASRAGDAGKVLAAACATARKTWGDWHPQTARCLTKLANALREQGEYGPAWGAVEEAMAIHKALVPATEADALAARLEAAAIESKRGRHAEARALLDGVVGDAQAAGAKAVEMAAKADLASLLDETGAYAVAEALAKEVHAYDAQTLGDAHPATVSAEVTIGSIYRKQGRLREAEDVFADAYARFTKVLGNDHGFTVIAANNLGEILEKEGLFDRAEPYLRQAYEGVRKLYGDSHPNTIVSMNNLALLHESQGEFDKAEALYKSAITLSSKKLGPNHPDTVAFVNNLAYLYLLKREYDKAAGSFRQVVDSWTKTYGPRHQNTLKAVNSLGRALHRQGKLGEAEPLLTRALEGRRAALGESHMDTLRSMHDLGALHRSAKRLDKARQLLELTRTADEAALGKLHPYTFETMETLAGAYEDLGDLAKAYEVRHETFLRRNEFLATMLYVTGENAREGYIRLHGPEYAAYLDLLARMDPAIAGRGILEASLNRKGLLFKVASEVTQVTRMARSPELAAIAQDLTATRKQLASLTLSGPTDATKDNHLTLISELENKVSKLQGDLGRASTRYYKATANISVDDLVAALPDDAVLVDFVQYGIDGAQKLVAATLRKEGGKPVFGFVRYDDPAALDAAVLKYRKDIQDEEKDLDDLIETGQATYDLIWKPVAAQVGSATKVFVIPDGTLNILPFSALVEKSGKYLMERVDLHVYTTSRNLLPSKLPPAKGGYMINAGPDYNTDQVTGKETLEKARSRAASPVQEGLRGMSSGMRGLKFDPLPGAEREGQLIRAKVDGTGKPNAIYSKADAQEKVLRDMNEPPEVLHIATHGFFLKADDTLRKRLLKLQRGGDIQIPPPGDNPLLRSGLAFAGVNANAQLLGEIDTDNDGVLTALEVLGLNLSGTRLAILSACETGLGEIHEGEGVYGLRRAFQEAGVGSVVSSLWEVSDAGTQTLMTALYGRLMAGKEPHQALREAQLEMLRIGQWSSPYIWSAFFMVDG